jgi:hypothetical protein
LLLGYRVFAARVGFLTIANDDGMELEERGSRL